MITKLMGPVLAAALLGACATGYDYRGGTGDYYYGHPSVDYYGGYGGYYGGYAGWGYGYGGYPYGYGYGYPYYGYGYGYPYYPPVIIVHPDRPGTAGPQRPGQHPGGPPGIPTTVHGRGHPWSSSLMAPMADETMTLPDPDFGPMPDPHSHMQRTHGHMGGVMEMPRVERDVRLRPHP